MVPKERLLRDKGTGEYQGREMSVSLTAEQSGVEGAEASAKTFRIAILGAGMGGLCMAVQLRKAGITSFVILEKGGRVGGTWLDNVYPGSGCDVPAPFSIRFPSSPSSTGAASSRFSGNSRLDGACGAQIRAHAAYPLRY